MEHEKQVPAAEVRAQALEEAAKLIDTKVYNYQDECGSYDHSTGVTEYPGNGAEWVCEMQELAEEIRALAQSSTADKASEVRSQALEEAAKWLRNNYQDHANIDSLCKAMCALAQSTDKASEVRAADPKQLAKWWSLRGSVITAAINQEPVRFPVEDLSELLNVFDAALPDAPSTAVSGNTGALGDTGGDRAAE